MKPSPLVAKLTCLVLEFVRIIQRHKQRMVKFPDEPPAYGVPYDGIENLRPESKAAVEAFLM